MGEQILDSGACIQKDKTEMAYIQCSLSVVALDWFLRLHEVLETSGLPLHLLSKNNFLHKKPYYAQNDAQAAAKENVETNVITVWKFNK